MNIVFLLLCSGAVLLEGSVTPLPLVYVSLLCFIVYYRNTLSFSLAFALGILLDIFRLRPVGETSIILLCFTLLILLYQRKYEIVSFPFVFIAGGIGSVFYLSLRNTADVVVLSVAAAFICGMLFSLLRILAPTLQKEHRLRYTL